MKRIAHSNVWWPTINKDMAQLAYGCKMCNSYAKTKKREPVLSWLSPSGPWVRLHLDFIGTWMSKTPLLVICAYSKWIEEVDTLSSLSALVVINFLLALYARFGTLRYVISDNGPAFRSHEFQFLRVNNVLFRNVFIGKFKKSYRKQFAV
jgi:hypothetical protein